MQTTAFFIVIAFVLWFAISNATMVTMHLFFWDVTISLALLTGIIFFLGFLLGMLHLTPSFWRTRALLKEQERKLAAEKEIRENSTIPPVTLNMPLQTNSEKK